jgi:hypothetical protein
MANKQSFTPEEWTKVLQSPMLVESRVDGGPERAVGHAKRSGCK